VSDEGREPCCQLIHATFGVPFAFELWKCSVCVQAFCIEAGKLPQACPLCASMFLVALIDDVYRDLR
jgi:rubrerythrin